MAPKPGEVGEIYMRLLGFPDFHRHPPLTRSCAE
jgi:hypothetical protein